jgi:hypothetical protein
MPVDVSVTSVGGPSDEARQALESAIERYARECIGPLAGEELSWRTMPTFLYRLDDAREIVIDAVNDLFKNVRVQLYDQIRVLRGR